MNSASRSVVVIPARIGSTRLPRKMLLADTGQTLVEHTYSAACGARHAANVLVATDSPLIVEVIQRVGGNAVLTSPDCASGTDRVAEVARSMPEADILVNLQGDEPEMAASAIDQVIELLEANPNAPMATLATPIRDPKSLVNPACVKVVFDSRGRAMYFSRSPIPFVRDQPVDFDIDPPLFHQHLGIYAYRREFLLNLANLQPSPTEQAEKLEQLRVLEAGHTILVGTTHHSSSGIDTAEDYRAFVQRQRRMAA